MTTIAVSGEKRASVQLAINCGRCVMIMKPDGSAYIVPASVYDEQPISRTYQYRKVRAFNYYCSMISLEQFERIIATGLRAYSEVRSGAFTRTWDSDIKH